MRYCVGLPSRACTSCSSSCPTAWPSTCACERTHGAGRNRFCHSEGHAMCGIVGVISQSPVNQLIYDSLLLLQHRGQDAAGIATADGSNFHMYKANGMVRDVFRTRNMRSLHGTTGIGQVRYPTAGSAS